jgi:3-dehydro-L-gulonate 2-dehydrogenase
MRLEYSEVESVLKTILLNHGFGGDRAALCAHLFTETTLDGVYSHGVNRFPVFIDSVKRDIVKPGNEPTLLRSLNNFENWDGNLGPGNLNAWFCMGRAIHLASEYGMAVASLRNTNHWMRGGSYGLQAAREDCIGICMTNTTPNMPPWGGSEAKIGNNPIAIAVPHEPYPILMDMAMPQFSYGKMEVLEQLGQKLPFAGGFDKDLQLTDEPTAILESGLALPAGHWKGAALAVMIDLLVSMLSGGSTTQEIGARSEEYGVSQLFIAFDLGQIADAKTRARAIKDVTDSLCETAAIEPGAEVFYPGQQTCLRREENLKKGIPVDPDTWEKIVALNTGNGRT